MLRRINHPNVIRLIDAQLLVQCPKKDGTFFETDMLVLELAEATLSEILYSTGPFEEPFVRFSDSCLFLLGCVLYCGLYSDLQCLQARKAFQQLISGIECCHLHGVFHRDLKPEQLLVCAEDKGELKIAVWLAQFRSACGCLIRWLCRRTLASAKCSVMA